MTICPLATEFLSNVLLDLQHVLFICFLLGESPASDLYMPTFRNALSVPSSKAGAFEDGTESVPKRRHI